VFAGGDGRLLDDEEAATADEAAAAAVFLLDLVDMLLRRNGSAITAVPVQLARKAEDTGVPDYVNEYTNSLR
jgi:hypothetical protein